jgi:hypothetical protein
MRFNLLFYARAVPRETKLQHVLSIVVTILGAVISAVLVASVYVLGQRPCLHTLYHLHVYIHARTRS